MVTFKYILGFSLGLLSQRERFWTYKVSDVHDIVHLKPQKGTFTTEIGTPIFKQYNIFEVEKQAYVALVALIWHINIFKILIQLNYSLFS